jgi:hypothetical protein
MQMTKAATATQAQIRRHVKAAYEAGASSVAIRPDGIVVAFRGNENRLIPAVDQVSEMVEVDGGIVL